MTAPRVSQPIYVLPVHNEEHVIVENVRRLASHLEGIAGAEVFLVENGSRDASWALAQELERASKGKPVPVHAFRESSAGLGYAYHRGLTEALARFGADKTRWAVLTAADLPFGFSDLESAREWIDASGARILMGSKAHRLSRANTGAKRKVMSAVYRAARRMALGMTVADSQGSVFLRLDLAAELIPRIEARGFFYSTELCHFAERAGEVIVEVPVVLEPSRRASTVRPVKDASEMARQLWHLRSRERP